MTKDKDNPPNDSQTETIDITKFIFPKEQEDKNDLLEHREESDSEESELKEKSERHIPIERNTWLHELRNKIPTMASVKLTALLIMILTSFIKCITGRRYNRI